MQIRRFKIKMQQWTDGQILERHQQVSFKTSSIPHADPTPPTRRTKGGNNIEDCPGIGKSSADKLRKAGIKTLAAVIGKYMVSTSFFSSYARRRSRSHTHEPDVRRSRKDGVWCQRWLYDLASRWCWYSCARGCDHYSLHARSGKNRLSWNVLMTSCQGLKIIIFIISRDDMYRIWIYTCSIGNQGHKIFVSFSTSWEVAECEFRGYVYKIYISAHRTHETLSCGFRYLCSSVGVEFSWRISICSQTHNPMVNCNEPSRKLVYL